MEWKVFNKENPPAPGKYIIQTRTSMGNSNKFESTFNGKSWNCSNQIVEEYLDEGAY